MNKELLKEISLPTGMYKVINCIEKNRIYEVEDLGLIKLTKWDGDQFLSVSKIDSNYNEVENLDIVLRPRHWITIDKEIYESSEPIYFYCK